ncbi:MAG: hypothetical protein IKF38_04960 [Clostridia bacterium]|nr:hypothetical protein [Clostridia bacterium]
MINKLEFVEIINKLKQVNDFVEETNDNARKLNDAIISDFFNASSLMVTHENIVVDLLGHMVKDKETLTWWLYEMDYGRKFKMGDFKVGEIDIDLSTSEKLYDYLVKVAKDEQIQK